MKLLAFSDLHRDRKQARRLAEMAGGVDVVAGVGDFASVHRGLERTIDALSTIEVPTLLVPGNNETDDALRAACAGWASATVLHGGAAEIDGAQFFGIGGGVPTTPWGWSFDLTEEEAARMLAGCPDGAVLLTHSPPKGHVDDGLGSEAILRAVEERRPTVVLCGHIHQCWEQESSVDGVRVLNLGPRGAVLDV